MTLPLTPTACWKPHTQHGEGALWSVEKQWAYWVDIHGQFLHAYRPADGARFSWPMPAKIGWVIETTSGGLVGGFSSGFMRIELDPVVRLTPILSDAIDPVRSHPSLRLNDAKADAWGRIWAGTMNDAGTAQADGKLYRLDPDGTLTEMDAGYHVTNGPTFSPDGKILYHTDSERRTIYAFDLDETGALHNKRVWVTLSENDGYPDGMQTDANGCVWVGHYAGHRVTCFSPEGKVLQTITLPVSNVTNCCFGGADLTQLFLTTSRQNFTAEDDAREPLAGSLFSVPLTVAGLPAAKFAG